MAEENIKEKIDLDYHVARVLPYYIDGKKIKFFLEKKDPNYHIREYKKGLYFLGGKVKFDQGDKVLDSINWSMKEEFWNTAKTIEEWKQKYGFDDNNGKYDYNLLKRIERAGAEIRFSMDYVGDYIVDLNLKGREKTTFGASIYTHRLNEEQYMDLKDLVEWQEGKLTTDNYRHESRVEIIDIKKINDHNKRFAGGYDQILNHLLEEGVFGHTRVRIENCLPPINIIARGKLVEDKDGPTFELLKENFYNYNGKNKIEDV